MVIKWQKWFLLLLALFILSYIREVSFLSINAILDGNTNFYAKTIDIAFLKEYPADILVKIKYLLTIIFSILFIFFTILGLKVSFIKNTPFQFSILAYLLILFISLILIVSALLLGNFKTLYPYLRILIGIMHNPIIFILISISFISVETLNENKK